MSIGFSNLDALFAEPDAFFSSKSPKLDEREQRFFEKLSCVARKDSKIVLFANHEPASENGLGKGYTLEMQKHTPLRSLLLSFQDSTPGRYAIPFSSKWFNTTGLLPVPEQALLASAVFKENRVEDVIDQFCTEKLIQLWPTNEEGEEYRSLLANGLDSSAWSCGFGGGGHFIGVFKEKQKEIDKDEVFQPFITNEAPEEEENTRVQTQGKVLLAFHSGTGPIGREFQRFIFEKAASSSTYTLSDLYNSDEYERCQTFAKRNVSRGLALLCESLQLPRGLMGIEPSVTAYRLPSSNEAPPDEIGLDRISFTCSNFIQRHPRHADTIVYYNACTSLVDTYPQLGKGVADGDKLVAILRRPEDGLYVATPSPNIDYTVEKKYCYVSSDGATCQIARANLVAAIPVGSGKLSNAQSIKDSPSNKIIAPTGKHGRTFFWVGKPEIKTITDKKMPGGNWRLFAYRKETTTAVTNLKILLGEQTKITQYQPWAQCIPPHESM